MAGDTKLFQEALKRGSAHAWNEQWDKAAEEYRRALRESPEDVSARTYLAMALYKSGSYQESLELYQSLWNSQPSNLTMLQRVAELQEAVGNREAASLSYGRLSEAHSRRRAVKEAFRAFHKVVELSPATPLMWNSLVQMAIQAGTVKDVIPGYLGFARELALQSRFQEAIQIADRARGLDPDNPLVVPMLAAIRKGIEYSLRAASFGEEVYPEDLMLYIPSMETMQSRMQAAESAAEVPIPKSTGGPVYLDASQDFAGQQVVRAISDGQNVVEIRLAPTPRLLEQGLTASTVRDSLGSLGEVVRVSPEVGAGGGIVFVIVLSTSAAIPDVQRTVEQLWRAGAKEVQVQAPIARPSISAAEILEPAVEEVESPPQETEPLPIDATIQDEAATESPVGAVESPAFEPLSLAEPLSTAEPEGLESPDEDAEPYPLDEVAVDVEVETSEETAAIAETEAAVTEEPAAVDEMDLETQTEAYSVDEVSPEGPMAAEEMEAKASVPGNEPIYASDVEATADAEVAAIPEGAETVAEEVDADTSSLDLPVLDLPDPEITWEEFEALTSQSEGETAAILEEPALDGTETPEAPVEDSVGADVPDGGMDDVDPLEAIEVPAELEEALALLEMEGEQQAEVGAVEDETDEAAVSLDVAEVEEERFAEPAALEMEVPELRPETEEVLQDVPIWEILMEEARTDLSNHRLDSAEMKSRRALEAAMSDTQNGSEVELRAVDLLVEIARERSSYGDLVGVTDGLAWLHISSVGRRLGGEAVKRTVAAQQELLGDRVAEHMEEIAELPSHYRGEAVSSLWKAEKLMEDGRLRLAADEMYRVLSSYPEFLPSQSVLARILVAQGRVREASERAHRLLDLYELRGREEGALEVLLWMSHLGLATIDDQKRMVRLLRLRGRGAQAETIEEALSAVERADQEKRALAEEAVRKAVEAVGGGTEGYGFSSTNGDQEPLRAGYPGAVENLVRPVPGPDHAEEGEAKPKRGILGMLRSLRGGARKAPAETVEVESEPSSQEVSPGIAGWQSLLRLAESRYHSGDAEGAASVIGAALRDQSVSDDLSARVALLRVLQINSPGDEGLQAALVEILGTLGLPEDLAN